MSTAGIPPRLAGAVAVVAGATRGAGRGIARALGEADRNFLESESPLFLRQTAALLREPLDFVTTETTVPGAP